MFCDCAQPKMLIVAVEERVYRMSSMARVAEVVSGQSSGLWQCAVNIIRTFKKRDRRCTVSMRLCWLCVIFVSRPAVVYHSEAHGRGWSCRTSVTTPSPKDAIKTKENHFHRMLLYCCVLFPVLFILR
jgi:hypothetical protein